MINIQKSYLVHISYIGPFCPLQSNLDIFGPFSPFCPLKFYSVQFGPFGFIQSTSVHSVYIGPIRSTLILFCLHWWGDMRKILPDSRELAFD